MSNKSHSRKKRVVDKTVTVEKRPVDNVSRQGSFGQKKESTLKRIVDSIFKR